MFVRSVFSGDPLSHNEKHWNVVEEAGLVRLGIVAARSAAAVRRATRGRDLDSFDRVALSELSSMLKIGAEEIEFFDSEGKRGATNGGFANGVGLAIETLRRPDQANSPPSQAKEFMVTLGEKVESFREDPKSPEASGLTVTLTALSKVVMRSLGSVGETATRI